MASVEGMSAIINKITSESTISLRSGSTELHLIFFCQGMEYPRVIAPTNGRAREDETGLLILIDYDQERMTKSMHRARGERL